MAGQAREIVLDGEIAVSDNRGVTHIEPTQRDAGGLKIVSAHSGLRQHLGMAPMHRGQAVSQFLIPFSVNRTWIERRSCTERSCERYSFSTNFLTL